MTLEFAGAAVPLTTGGVAALAARLNIDPAAIWAVCDVESAGGGFLPDKRPKILYEAHIFGRLTGHRFDASHPNVSAPSWDRALYGATGAHQYDRLAEAIGVDPGDGSIRAGALESASWGMFQILGMNYSLCGFGCPEDFVAAQVPSEDAQLDAFAGFIHHGGLEDALRRFDWTTFALGYNGAGEAENEYHQKLAADYARRHAQLADPDRQAAVMVFQRAHPPLLVDGIAGPKTIAAGYVDAPANIVRAAAPTTPAPAPVLPVSPGGSVTDMAAAIGVFEAAAGSLQTRLKTLGLYNGPIDKDWGKDSRAALIAFKARQG